jgi:hypothetical protein
MGTSCCLEPYMCCHLYCFRLLSIAFKCLYLHSVMQCWMDDLERCCMLEANNAYAVQQRCISQSNTSSNSFATIYGNHLFTFNSCSQTSTVTVATSTPLAQTMASSIHNTHNTSSLCHLHRNTFCTSVSSLLKEMRYKQ